MKKLFGHLNSFSNKYCLSLLKTTAIAIVCCPFILLSQNSNKGSKSVSEKTDEQLIEQFINAKGSGIISFDGFNIKQYWVENSVIGKADKIDIRLSQNGPAKFESVPFKIQLANVTAYQDCKVEIISQTPDFSFSVLDSKSKVISSSSKEQDFLGYSIVSSVFHLDRTKDFSFYIKFSSQKDFSLSIKRIVLSFSRSNNFLSSPGVLKVSADNISLDGLAYPGVSVEKITQIDDSSFSATGTWFEFNSEKRIVLSSNPVKYKATVKNIGDEPTIVYVGYAPYTKEGTRIKYTNNLYKNNKILKVVRSESNSNKVIVDSYPEWTKGCYLALNAKEDLSDFPNFSLVEGKIVDVKKIDDNQTEIVFDKPLKYEIAKGTQVRIQSLDGSGYLYMNKKTLQPGEEAVFSSTVEKDDNFFEFSPKAFCRGTYFVIPIFMSHSVDSKRKNTIQISDYEISY